MDGVANKRLPVMVTRAAASQGDFSPERHKDSMSVAGLQGLNLPQGCGAGVSAAAGP